MKFELTTLGWSLCRKVIQQQRLSNYANGVKNKTNHPISSNSHPSATANKTIHSLKIGVGGIKQREHNKILIKYEAVHPTTVSENNSSSGMLII